MGAPSGHPLQHVQKVHPLGDNPFGVNFGQNYRDLGHFVRVTFYGQNYRHPFGVPQWAPHSGHPYVGTLSGTHMHLMGTPFGAPICGHPIGYPHAPNGHPIRGTHISEIYFIRGRTMCSHRPHFVVLNGHPYGAPIWVPYRAPISRFHFVKLLPLRGRHVCMWGDPWRCTYFARFHFVDFFFFCGLLRAL